MTRAEIIRMAREAGYTSYDSLSERLHEFAALVVAAEREACADICDSEATIEGIAQKCASAIRARSQS